MRVSYKSVVFMAAAALAAARFIPAEEIRNYPVEPVSTFEVRIEDPFWSPRQDINRNVTIPHCIKKNRESGRIVSPVLFKAMEAAAYALDAAEDPKLEKQVKQWMERIVKEHLPSQSGKTWEDLGWTNSLYAAGHFFEAAAACYKSFGNRKILDAAIRIADRIDELYGPDKRNDSPGHAEIETGLAKLFRATGDDRYLRLSDFFLDQRGRTREFFGRRMYGEYYQDHLPAAQQFSAAGHAVSALYMYMGMTDVTALSGTAAYRRALDEIWADLFTRKLAVTGGIGARRLYEGFGEEFELPNFICWNETCAAIGGIMWNHRMFLADPDAKYIDTLERALYNGFLVGVSQSGDRFFYQNPLLSFGDYERSDWFGVACCPPNLARLMASLGGYIYARKGRDIYINLFIGSLAQIDAGGNPVTIRQTTEYPWDGRIKLRIDPGTAGEFTLFLRIPSWARGRPLPGDLYRYVGPGAEKPVLKLNGDVQPLRIERGYARIERRWEKGDTLDLLLPMPVRRILAQNAVISGRGRVALERGPVVYCAEWPDNGGNVLNLLIPDQAALKAAFQEDLLGGVGIVTGRIRALQRARDGIAAESDRHDLTAIPYFAWANRGKGEMAVWLAREPSAARISAMPTLAAASRISSSPSKPSGAPGIGNHGALVDQMEPRGSSDDSFSFFRLIPEEGDTGWVQFDFQEAAEVSAVDVYWLDDHRFCVPPASWRVLFRENGEWKPVDARGSGGTARDTFNRIDFDPVRTGGLRLEIKPEKRFYFNGVIGPPGGNFIMDGPVEWYECGIIEVRIYAEK